MTAENNLAERIRLALVGDERLSAHPIEVIVEKGVVTLKGTVQSYNRKLAAQEIASLVQGVRGVINNLSVEPADAVPDEEIAENVRRSLDSHADVTKESITVNVNVGEATLTGNVGSSWESVIAEDVARSVRGVRDVRNQLLVDPFEQVLDESVAGNIQEALQNTAGLGNTAITAAFSDEGLVLSGTVDYFWQRETAERIAQRFRPLRLRNDILVKEE